MNAGKLPFRKFAAAAVVLILSMGALVFGSQPASAAPTAQTCSYANAGTGDYARTLCWFDMSNYNQAAAEAPGGQEMQTTLPGGYVVRYFLQHSGRPVNPNSFPTFGSAFIGGSSGKYTGVAGRPALYQPSSSTDLRNTVLTMSNITVRDANNQPVTAFSIVGADAEQTDDGEQIAWTSDQPMNQLIPIGNACGSTFTGVGTTTVTCASNNVSARTGAAMLAAQAPTTMTQTITGLRAVPAQQGVAFGILLSKVVLNKTVASRVDPADSFTLNVATASSISLRSASTGTASTATTGEVETIGATTGSPFTLSETSAPSALANYAKNWSCTRNGAADPTLPSGAAGTSVPVNLAIGDLVSCTITNTALPGRLTLKKTAGPVTDVNGNGIRDAGDTIPYSFLVTNAGQLTLENIGVTDPAGGTVTCPVTTLAPGSSTTCTTNTPYTFTVADQTAGTFLNNATAQGNPLGAATAIVRSNLSATITNLSTPAPALTMTKTASPTTVTSAGSTVSYSYAVTNSGNVPISALSIAETAFSGSGTAPVPSCPVTTLAPSTSTTCTATYTVTQADIDAGTLTNTAHATATAGVTPVISPDSSASVTATAAPSISVLKSVSPSDAASYVVGQLLTYTFVATNTGNVTLTNVVATETAFTGSGTPLTPACPPSAPIAPGGQVTCTASYTLTQVDIDTGQITNTATASGTPPTGGPVTSTPSSVTTPANQNPELTLSKTANPTSIALAGDQIIYTFTVTNSGNVTITDVTVDETAFSGTGTPPVITCATSLTTMLPGASATCTATYTLTQPDADTTQITNTATATGTPPAGGTVTSLPATATVTVTQNPALTLTKTASPLQATAAGQTITYSFLVTNSGDVTITDVAIDEGTFTGTGTPPAITCPVGAASLAPGDSVTCTGTYTTTQADADTGGIDNDATATGTPPAGGTTTSPESAATVPITASPGITINKTVSASSYSVAGQTVTYSFLVTNTGNVTLTSGAVQETRFTGRGIILNPVCPPGITSLAPNESVTCTADYVITQADVDGGQIENTANVTATTPNSGTITAPPSTVDIAAQAAPTLSIEKTVTPLSVTAAGQTVTYSYLITNTGNVTMTDVTAVEGTFTGTGPIPIVSCPAGAASLAPGGTVTCTATYTATQDDLDASTVTNTATATGTPPGGGAQVTSSPSLTTFSVIETPHLTLVKTANPNSVTRAGQAITYSFVVTNDGNVTMTNIAVAEKSFSGAGIPPVITCPPSPISLAPGNTVTCTATYTTVQEDVDRGALDNTATVSGAPKIAPFTSTEYDPASSTVTSAPTPALSIVKSATPSDEASFIAGATITYSFVVTNTGNVTLTDIGVAETAFTGSGTAPSPTCPIGAASLAPDAQIICTGTYVVTQADVDAGGITNTATATGTPPGEQPPITSTSSTIRIPQLADASMSMVKTGILSADNISYTFTLTNTGNVTLTDATVTETAFTGTGAFPSIVCPPEAASLLPGQVIVCTATYTLTEKDKDAGSVKNTAIGGATGPNGAVTSDPSSAVVALGGLVNTGLDTGNTLAIAALLLALGGTISVVVYRRRRSSVSQLSRRA